MSLLKIKQLRLYQTTIQFLEKPIDQGVGVFLSFFYISYVKE